MPDHICSGVTKDDFKNTGFVQSFQPMTIVFFWVPSVGNTVLPSCGVYTPLQTTPFIEPLLTKEKKYHFFVYEMNTDYYEHYLL